jgi:hypothetical protein
MGHGHDTGLPLAFRQFCQLFVPIEKRLLALLRAAISPALLYSCSPTAVVEVSASTEQHYALGLPCPILSIPSPLRRIVHHAMLMFVVFG